MKLVDYKKLAPAINADVTAILAKHGLKLTKLKASIEEGIGTIRYTIVAVDLKMTTDAGDATTSEAEMFKRDAELIGLNPKWLGRSIRSGGVSYVIAGLKNTRSPKCVVMARDGKTYLTTVAEIIRLIGKTEEATL